MNTRSKAPARLVLAARVLSLIAVAVLFGLLVWRVTHREPSSVPVVIDERKPIRSPAFDLPLLEGDRRLTLASLRGKAVVLNFWASWCAPCKEEIPALEATWKQHRAHGLVVVGVNVQDAAGDARAFARRTGITYPLVRDKGAKTLDRFSVISLPETLFVNRRGQIVGTRIQGGVHLEKHERRFGRGVALALGR
jgi:cytochrome c biogenesis protein CcmG, thiol:disulfide interchange protein DsbE